MPIFPVSLKDALSEQFRVNDVDIRQKIACIYKKYYLTPYLVGQQAIQHGQNPQRVFVRRVNGVDFSCLFIKGNGPYLYCIYNGAREYPYNYFKSPQIPRWSYFNFISGSVLGIDDPMYVDYSDLKLGWYYGTEERFYAQDSLSIVNDICQKENINPSNIIFFSSSGGGYAALMAASMLKGTLSLAINPQLYLRNWWYAKHFCQITGIDLCTVDRFSRNDPASVLAASPSKHIIIVNIASFDDYEMQLIPLVQALGISNLRLGLNICNNILIWLYYAPSMESPHTSFETKGMFAYINAIALDFKENNSFNVDNYQDSALALNLIWYDIYEIKNKNYLNLTKNVDILPVIPMNNLYLLKTYHDVKLSPKDNCYNYYAIQEFQSEKSYAIHCKRIHLVGANQIT